MRPAGRARKKRLYPGGLTLKRGSQPHAVHAVVDRIRERCDKLAARLAEDFADYDLVDLEHAVIRDITLCFSVEHGKEKQRRAARRTK